MKPLSPRLVLCCLLLAPILPLRAEQVVLSEIMYHPAGASPEYLEIQNLTATVFDIAEWTFTDGIDYTFPAFSAGDSQATFLKAFERILVSPVDEATLRAAYTIPAGTRVFGPWTGSLDNAGERVTLKNKNGLTMTSVAYNDRGNFSNAPDGTGHSLVLKATNRLADDWRQWRSSTNRGGSPGSEDPAPGALRNALALSEVAFATGLDSTEWVEIFNRGSSAVSLAGISLASTLDFSDKVPLGASIASGAYASVNATFPVPAGTDRLPMFLLDGSDNVIAAALIRRAVATDVAQTFPAGSTEWYSTASATRDSANNPDRNTDIVVNEIMYDPPSKHRNGEFIELYNRGTAPKDLSQWSFTDGVSFTFPIGTQLAPGAYLVVAADAAWIRSIYGKGIMVVGDYTGTLSNGGELLRLADARGNLVDKVDYRPSGDWPELADGDGSSMELKHPSMDNDSPSAWADSDESQKSTMQTFTYSGNYLQLNSRGDVNEYREFHFHLTGDAYVILENISLKQNGTGANQLQNVTQETTNGNSATGWLIQGNHYASFVDNGQLHLICDGHGDNKANRAEIDCTGLVQNQNYEISFDARWVYGKPRLIAQTWDHTVGSTFLIPVPNNLGTPGTANSRLLAAPAPSVTGVLHSPAVPGAGQAVTITARVDSVDPLASVNAVYRLDNAGGNGAWQSAAMNDGGTNGDSRAGDGIYSARVSQYTANGNIIQFYVEATTSGGALTRLPKLGAERPAMWIVSNATMGADLTSQRFILSQFDRNAMTATGFSTTYNYKFPRMSNHYYNATFILNETDVHYNAEIRKSGSPFTRDNGNGLSHAKWKLPGDRLFRGRRKAVVDPSGADNSDRYDDRMARYFLYLLGAPAAEEEFVRVAINGDGAGLRVDMEPISDDFLDRNFGNGSDGTLLRIDDEWFFEDQLPGEVQTTRGSRNADWSYKNSDNPVRYHSEWLMRNNETAYDYSSFIDFVKMVGPNTFTREQIDRVADPIMMGMNAAVRGYDGDWDTITLRRGKNAYFYRKPDGLWTLIHWDGDRVFESTSEVILGTLPGIPNYFNTPHVRRAMNYYLTELLDKWTRNSPRTAAWLQAEENASTAYNVDGKYATWFNGRAGSVEAFLGEAYSNTSFGVTTEATHPNPEVDLSVGLPVVQYAHSWDFNDQNLDLGTAWRDVGYTYSHAGWTLENAAGNVGGIYGFETSPLPAPGLRTPMLNSNDAANHLTYYFRKAFDYTGPLNDVDITIDLIVDDGALFYLNGTLLGGVGVPANPNWKTTANRTVGEGTEELAVVSVPATALVNGTNVIACEVHQTNATSSDCVFAARVSLSAPAAPSVVINEVLPAGAGNGFVEFYNPTAAAIDLNGWYLSDSSTNLTKFQIAQSLVVPASGFASIGYTESALGVANPTVVYLTGADGLTIANAIQTTMPLDGRSLGRQPDGSGSWFLYASPTRNSSNQSGPTSANFVTLNGNSPSRVFSVRIPGHPEAVFNWESTTTWSLAGVSLVGGMNTFAVEGIDQDGNVVESTPFSILKTGNAPPIVRLNSSPSSLNVGVSDLLALDAGASFDPEGGVLTYAWSSNSPNATLTPSGSAATVRFARPGLYTFTVTASDDQLQERAITREVAVYNEADFTRFNTTSLPAPWQVVRSEVRDNYSPSGWYSLQDKPGNLVVQVEDDNAKPLSGSNFPTFLRPLPASTNWSLHTDLSLEGALFGDYQTGLFVTMNENGMLVRYAFGVENGSQLSVQRLVGAVPTTVASIRHGGSTAVLRVRRFGTQLHFEKRENMIWQSVFIQTLVPATTANEGGLFSATDVSQRINTRFDYVLLVDSGSVPAQLASLRITELMYNHPAGPTIEFIELGNRGLVPLDLSGVSFDATRPFGALTLGALALAPGEAAVVVGNTADFIAQYGAGPRILAQWPDGQLSNGGERVVIRDAFGNSIHDFTYDDENGWPLAADGLGSSLEVIDTEGNYNDPANWRASLVPGGTPGSLQDPDSDSDGDGLTDLEEDALGTNPHLADTDGDGSNDGAEVAAGTNPLDGGSVFRIATISRDAVTGAVTLTWSSVAGKNYKLESITNLAPGAWMDVNGGAIIPSGGASTSTVIPSTPPGDLVRFYRAVVVP
jgi:hypothetical protein